VELNLDDFTRIRFGQDKRLDEVARMLQSSDIPTVRMIERPELRYAYGRNASKPTARLIHGFSQRTRPGQGTTEPCPPDSRKDAFSTVGSCLVHVRFCTHSYPRSVCHPEDRVFDLPSAPERHYSSRAEQDTYGQSQLGRLPQRRRCGAEDIAFLERHRKLMDQVQQAF